MGVADVGEVDAQPDVTARTTCGHFVGWVVKPSLLSKKME